MFGMFAQNSVLDYNNVSALVGSSGVQFSNTQSSIAAYEVPKGSGLKTIYAAAFWFAGIDQNGVLRNSNPKYTPASDVFTGPYSTTSSYSDPQYFSKYQYSNWYVTNYDIVNHIQNYMQPGYVVPASIANWPGNGDLALGVANNLAPFIDVDGDNIYNPMLGDHPDIRGDVATYVIMNDASAVHTETGGESMGIEVHLMFYQYISDDFLNNTTFINMRVFNRGAYTYENFKVGLYMDADLGNYADDYFGSYSSKNLVYIYNADSDDENNAGSPGYGINPPCMGVTSLNTNFSSAGYYTSAINYPYNDPSSANEVWNVMNARWNNGTPWASNFPLDGNPYTGTGTTEVGLSNPGGDRRMVMNFDSVQMFPGGSLCEDFAILYNRGNDNLHSVQTVIDLADSVKLFYDNQLEYNCNQVTASITENTADQFIIYPNPNTGNFSIKPSENMEAFELVISDPSGRVLQRERYGKDEIVGVDLKDYKGICFVSVISNNSILTQRVIIN